jgi:hypothetical protein
MKETGFRVLRVTETSENAADIAKRRHDAREKRKNALIAAEGEANFEGLQRFLSCVQRLTSERRLLRYVYLHRKQESRARSVFVPRLGAPCFRVFCERVGAR